MATPTPFEARQIAEVAAKEFAAIADSVKSTGDEKTAEYFEGIAEVYQGIVDEFDEMMQN